MVIIIFYIFLSKKIQHYWLKKIKYILKYVHTYINFTVNFRQIKKIQKEPNANQNSIVKDQDFTLNFYIFMYYL